MTWKPEYANCENEARKVKYDIVKYTRGKVLDLGCGPWKTFPHFIGIDNMDELVDIWRYIGRNPDITMDATNLSIFSTGSFDAVFSSFLLDQVDDPEKTLREWWRVVKPGGYLILYLPLKGEYPSKGEEGCNPLHQWDFDQNYMQLIFGESAHLGGYICVKNEKRIENDEYSFLVIFQKAPYKLPENKKEKTSIVLRYGGIGDSLQAASILPQLKEQGYHVTFLTQPDGHEVLKHDPNIDEFFIVDRGQVPMEELGAFWASLRKKYDRFINLTESVEVGMLPVPGMTCHKWPKSVRHYRYNENYLEFTHMLAELPYEPHVKFYNTKQEKEWALKYKKKKGGRFIMWAVGSSIHKVCPYMDQIIARVLIKYPDVKILLVGDELDRMLDTGWEKEPRIIKKAGKWSVRETLSFAKISDLVIGAETGILNAICQEDVPKIIMLSHSSENNLTRDWVNCSTITPDNCECYPCHQLNASFNDCPRHETGVAMCQGKINVENIWEAIQLYL